MSKEIVTKLSAKEQEVLTSIGTKRGESIENLIPDTIDSKDWLFQSTLACRALMRIKGQEQGMILILGRLLFLAKNNPTYLTDNGFATFTDFLEGKIYSEFGVSHGTVYDALQIATRWGSLTMAEVEAVGRKNFRVLSKVIEKGKESGAQARKLIEKAKEMTETEFENFCVDTNLIESGESQGANIRIPCSKATFKKWNSFINDGRVQSVVGGPKPEKILRAMMEECSGEWLKKGQETIDAEAETVDEVTA